MLIQFVIAKLFFASNVCIAHEIKLFERDPQTDGYECYATDSTLLETHDSYIHCAAHCRATIGCKRMFYDAGTKQCVGCSTIRYQLSGSAGSLSYITVSTTKDMVYLGCFPDRKPRVLPNGYFASSSLTNESCFQYCIINRGYRYMGSGVTILYFLCKNGRECFCGNGYEAYNILPDSNCTVACTGDSANICGGGWKISIYTY